MVRSDVLTFGDFTTKSGRQTPFFINTAAIAPANNLRSSVSSTPLRSTDRGYVDILFGPAYKGIPLVATASIGLAACGRDIGYLFVEAEDHGEGGVLVVALPADGDRVLIVDAPPQTSIRRRCRSCRPMPTSTSSTSSSPPIGRNVALATGGTRPGRQGLFDDDEPSSPSTTSSVTSTTERSTVSLCSTTACLNVFTPTGKRYGA